MAAARGAAHNQVTGSQSSGDDRAEVSRGKAPAQLDQGLPANQLWRRGHCRRRSANDRHGAADEAVNFVCEYYTASGAQVRGTLATIGGAKYGNQEAAFTKESTAIPASGSGLDILAQSASQGALQQAVIQRQGLITEQGYEEQAQSYRNMESAADMAVAAEKNAAKGAAWGAGFEFAGAIASLFTGRDIKSLLGGPGGAQLGGLVGMPEGEGGGFLGGFGGAG
jgi:hypothetical protein